MNVNWMPKVFLMGAIGTAASWSQVSDDFDDGNDEGWTRSNPLAEVGGSAVFSFPEGNTYRIQAGASPNPDALGQARVGSLREDIDQTSFRISVDIVEAATAVEQDFGILARVTTPGLGTLNGYSATFDSDEERLFLSRVDSEQASALGAVDVPLEEGKAYRLVFHGYQEQFLVEVFDVTDLTTPVVSVAGSDDADIYSSGAPGLFGNAGLADGTVDVTFDNFAADSHSDVDQDGMSDPAEAAAFGNLDQSGEGDFDNDGRSNGEELRVGSNPTVPDAAIEVTNFSVGEEGVTVRFVRLEGRDFQLETSLDLENWLVDEEAVLTDLGGGESEFESELNEAKVFVRVTVVDAG